MSGDPGKREIETVYISLPGLTPQIYINVIEKTLAGSARVFYQDNPFFVTDSKHVILCAEVS